MDLFRVRLNCVDHYQADQTVFDPDLPRGTGIVQQKLKPKLPVIRIFGATETGQKVCAHIHGAFPYMYIKYNGSLISDDGKTIFETPSILHLTGIQWMLTSTNSTSPSTMP